MEAEKTDKTFRVVRLEAENVKRLRAVAFDPAKHAVIIGGANSSGKSSLLDSLFYALGGGRALPEMPIRAGEERATIRVDLGGLTVERVIKPTGATLVVRNAEGDALQSPQRILDRMVGTLTFDPLEFVRADAKTQVKMLATVLGVSVETMDVTRKAMYERRTAVNRALREREVLAAAVVPEPGEVPSSAVLLDELGAVQAADRAMSEARRAVREAQTHFVQCGADVHNAQAKVDRLEAELAQAKRDLYAERGALVEVQDRLVLVRGAEATQVAACAEQRPVEAIRADLEAHSVRVAEAERQRLAWRAWRDNVLRVEAERQESQALTDELAAMDAERAALVAEGVARIGLAGLDVAEHGVTFHGVPIKQVSSAEQLRVAVGLGFAANPQIRIVLLREGALLDDASLAAVVAMAEQADAQVWIEVVGDRGPGSVIIEDGAIREVPHD